MHLIETFLPISVNDPQSKIEAVRRELVEQFGGATLHINAPAEGLWQDEGSVERDRNVIA